MTARLVASPAYLARAGTPRTPEELAGHETVPHHDLSWVFVRDGRRHTFRPRGRFTADSGQAELAAVVAGLGLAVMPDFLAGPALARGALVTLLADYEVPPAGLYVVRPPPADPMPMKVRVLVELMVETFGGAWDSVPRGGRVRARGRSSRASAPAGSLPVMPSPGIETPRTKGVPRRRTRAQGVNTLYGRAHSPAAGLAERCTLRISAVDEIRMRPPPEGGRIRVRGAATPGFGAGQDCRAPLRLRARALRRTARPGNASARRGRGLAARFDLNWRVPGDHRCTLPATVV